MADTPLLRVRWSEVDAQGVVFNANYLTYADIAATEHMRAIGLLPAFAVEVGQLYVVDAHIQFRAPARFDDLLAARVTIDRPGVSSHAFRIELLRDDTLLCTVALIYVRAVDGASTPLSAGYRAAIEAAMRVDDEGR